MPEVRKTPKDSTVLMIVDYVLETHKPHVVPCVLMWRELMNGFNTKHWPDSPLWTRDDRASHEHWKKYGPGVLGQLRQRYKLTIVKVGSKIRDLAKHGFPPDRDTKKRTDAAYRACLPHSTEMVRGFVAFPRETQEDHPLIVASLDRRARSSATGFENAINATDMANDCKVLSDGARLEIRNHVIPIVNRSIEDKYPLFPQKAIEG